MHQLTQTIDTKSLTLADWLAIAHNLGNDPFWGYRRWVVNADSNMLKALLLEDWEEIAIHVGKDDDWAYEQYATSNPDKASAKG